MMSAEPYDGHFVMIPLSGGKFAIVDEADAPLVLNGKRWSAAQRRSRAWYATQGRVGMHALIAGFKGADHVNRNGLDNRRINLRPATPSQNSANVAPTRSNTSGYKGVSWDRRRSKWVVQIGYNGSAFKLGLFDDPVEAARAYNRAAVDTFGEYAWLNPV